MIRKINMLDFIIFLFMILFIYAATMKLAEHDIFKAQIGKSPLIMSYADLFAWIVPLSEFLVVILLFIPRFVLLGLYGSFSLMFAFTLYILFILLFSPYVPCSCGGILNKMGWTEHLIFNIAFTILAIVGIALHTRRSKNNVSLA